MHLQIDVTEHAGYTVLSPQGEIDFATGPQLKEAITERLVAGDVHLVVDLLAVDFIESTGLGALIGGRRRAQALNGSLTLVCTEAQVLKVFRITGLDKVFDDLRVGRGRHRGAARAERRRLADPRDRLTSAPVRAACRSSAPAATRSSARSPRCARSRRRCTSRSPPAASSRSPAP